MKLLTAAAALAFLAPALPAGAEEFTMDTYYPSPAGVYNSVTVLSSAALASDGGTVVIGARTATEGHSLQVAGASKVNFIQMKEYNSAQLADASLLPGESKPAPGRLLYNRDNDRFYYTSKDAVAGDRDTWLKPVSGFDSEVVGEGTYGSEFMLPGSYGWVKPVTIVIGRPAGSGDRVGLLGNASNKLLKSGFYTVEASGKWCVSNKANPKMKLRIRYAHCGNWYTATAMDEQLDLTVPQTTPFYCEDFTLSGMVYMRAGCTATFGLQGDRDGGGSERLMPGSHIKIERVLSF